MKLSTEVTYNHKLTAPKGKRFDESKLPKIIEILGSDNIKNVRITQEGKTLVFDEQEENLCGDGGCAHWSSVFRNYLIDTKESLIDWELAPTLCTHIDLCYVNDEGDVSQGGYERWDNGMCSELLFGTWSPFTDDTMTSDTIARPINS